MNQDRIEEVYKDALDAPIQRDSELSGVLRQLNEDRPERDSHFRTIDLKTRLHAYELAGIIVHDSLVGLHCIEEECLVTSTQKKRLAVSLDGKGREESVEIVKGERQRRTGFMDKLGGMFRPQQP